ncbi:MAG: hypothetical protein QW590_03315 [Candidatus Bilamarchaeaceae archaeon]
MRCWILIFLLASVSFGIECRGYNESFDVRVLDAQWRPIQGADVSVMFDRGLTFGEQYYTTQPKETNESGRVHFSFSNGGTTTRKIDCRIWIFVSYGPSRVEKVINATQHGPTVDVFLPIYIVRFLVTDQYGNPLGNATVFFLNKTKRTDNNGNVAFYSKNQTAIPYLVSYLGGEETGVVSVAGDTMRHATIPIYNISVLVVDDRGVPLSADVVYLNTTYQINGSTSLAIYEEKATLTVIHGDAQQTITISPARSRNATIPFDTHPPTIGDVRETFVGKDRVRLLVDITDEGVFASGVKTRQISARYRILPDGKLESATVFVLSLNTYGIDFPKIENGRIVEFVLEAQDYNGNKALKEGRFVVQVAPTTEENKSEEEQEKKEEQEFPFFYIVFGVIFIIIVFYIVKSLKQKQERGG